MDARQAIQSTDPTFSKLEEALTHFKKAFDQSGKLYRYYWGFQQCLSKLVETATSEEMPAQVEKYTEMLESLPSEPARLNINSNE